MEPIEFKPKIAEEEKPRDADASTVLHLIRIRGKEDPNFYDPQTDLRILYPRMARSVVGLLREVLQTKEGALEQLDRLHQCLVIFELRLIEDATCLVTQMELFNKAYRELDPELRILFESSMLNMTQSIFALFVRRDSVVDKDTLGEFFASAALGSVFEGLSEPLRAELRKQWLHTNGKASVKSMLIPDDSKRMVDSIIECVETEELTHRVRDRAAKFMDATGPISWDALADACDEEFSTGVENLTDNEGIILALAYPTYKHPCMAVSRKLESYEPKG